MFLSPTHSLSPRLHLPHLAFKRAQGLPWWPGGYDSVLPMQGTWLWSLVGDLKSRMPCSMARKLKKFHSHTARRHETASAQVTNDYVLNQTDSVVSLVPDPSVAPTLLTCLLCEDCHAPIRRLQDKWLFWDMQGSSSISSCVSLPAPVFLPTNLIQFQPYLPERQPPSPGTNQKLGICPMPPSFSLPTPSHPQGCRVCTLNSESTHFAPSSS